MRNSYSDLSDLEREFELEMEGEPSDDLETEFESLAGDWEYERDSEFERDEEGRDGLDVSVERGDDEIEFEGENGDPDSEFVERFLEIGKREFESPYEVDAAMGEVLDDIEREYFFGAIKRGLKKLSKNKLLKSLAKKGLSMGVSKFLPGLKGALQLARGNVKGALLNFGKQALGSVVPGGGVMLDAVKSIGLQSEGEGPERETWENYVTLSREAYEYLAENLTPKADQPAEAVRLANNAIQHAIASAQVRSAGSRRPTGAGRRRGTVHRIRVAPGESIKLIIVGA